MQNSFNDIMMCASSEVEYTTEPTTYYSTVEKYFSLDVTSSENRLLVTSHSKGNVESCFDGLRLDLNRFSPKMKNVRHDFVANCCGEETDVRFSEIDPNYSESTAEAFHMMSPDFFVEDRRWIGELGTSSISVEPFLNKTYLNKFNKYSPYLERVMISRLYVFIVSPTMIVTNFPLDEDSVNLLCARCRFALSMEDILSVKFGFDFSIDEEQGEYYKLAENVFNTIGVKDLGGPEEDLNRRIMRESKLEMSVEEQVHVKDLLERTLQMTSNLKSRGEIDLKFIRISLPTIIADP